MSYKRLIPCIFIKDGKAVRWIDDPTVVSKDVIELAKYYSDHGADELIVLDAELGPQGLELAADAVHEFLRGLPGRFGGLDDLVAVLVRAGQEPRILAEQRMETAQAVRNDGRIGVPKVRAGVHVINRCRNIKRGGHGKAPFMVFRICRP